MDLTKYGFFVEARAPQTEPIIVFDEKLMKRAVSPMKVTVDRLSVNVNAGRGAKAVVMLWFDEDQEPIELGTKITKSHVNIDVDCSYRGVNSMNSQQGSPCVNLEAEIKRAVDTAMSAAKAKYDAIVTRRLDWKEQQFIPFRQSVNQLEWRSQSYRFLVEIDNRVAKVLSMRGGLLAAHVYHINFVNSPVEIFNATMAKL